MAFALFIGIAIVGEFIVTTEEAFYQPAVRNGLRSYKASEFEFFKKEEVNPCRQFGDLPENVQIFMNCTRQKKKAREEGLIPKDAYTQPCADMLPSNKNPNQKRRKNRYVEDDSESLKYSRKSLEGKRVPKGKMKRTSRNRRRKSEQAEKDNGKLDEHLYTRRQETESRERETRKLGSCGYIYTMKAGTKQNFKLPKDLTLCEMGFEADDGAELNLRCRKFSISGCSREYLYLAMDDSEK
ncbi:hypothetical protein SK128_000737, partial [Halocaridina rubra]